MGGEDDQCHHVPGGKIYICSCADIPRLMSLHRIVRMCRGGLREDQGVVKALENAMK